MGIEMVYWSGKMVDFQTSSSQVGGSFFFFVMTSFIILDFKLIN